MIGGGSPASEQADYVGQTGLLKGTPLVEKELCSLLVHQIFRGSKPYPHEILGRAPVLILGVRGNLDPEVVWS